MIKAKPYPFIKKKKKAKPNPIGPTMSQGQYWPNPQTNKQKKKLKTDQNWEPKQNFEFLIGFFSRPFL